MVDISTIRVVDDLTRSWVLFIVGNIIIHHNNDLVIRYSMGMNNLTFKSYVDRQLGKFVDYYLVSMADISLVTVVEPSIASCHQNHPEVSILRDMEF